MSTVKTWYSIRKVYFSLYRRSFDHDLFFHDREVIADLCLKKDRKVIAIAKIDDRDLQLKQDWKYFSPRPQIIVYWLYIGF